MQTLNNPNFYLRKNFYKQYSYYGTPYLSEQCDINTSDNLIVYGPFIEEQKDITLKFKGSANQRVIDMEKTRATASKTRKN